ncbi:MAG TPA: glycine zipper domain-containing protein [Syntrophobacteraceae bacterium]|nr:glycine zipper domain-containing protein [Syntrophobacteraceae bacterium]
MRVILKTLLLAILMSSLAGCANMSAREQRMLSGGAIGAGTGAAIGAVTGGSPAVGAAVGGAAGVVGGAIVDELENRR